MAKATNSRGRPKKDPALKLEQFSVRLNYELKMAVELIARKEGISISQVVERAVGEWIANYPLTTGPFVPYVRGRLTETFAELVQAAEREVEEFGIDPAAYPDVADRIKAITTLALADRHARLLHAPDELLTDEDRYFVAVIREVGLWKNFEVLDGIRSISDSSFRAGLDARSAVERVTRALDSLRARHRSIKSGGK